jgi:hypothetical protein
MLVSHRLLALLAAMLITTPAAAELPLAVENLIAGNGQTLLDLSLAYANSEQTGVSIGAPLQVQTGPASFITLPSAIGPSELNSDIVAATLGLRHGFSRRFEVNARSSMVHSQLRGQDLGGQFARSQTRFADAWLGASYQLREDERGPALLGFAELALAERGENDTRDC